MAEFCPVLQSTLEEQGKLVLGWASGFDGTGAPLCFVASLPSHAHKVAVEAGLSQAVVHNVVHLAHP